MYWNNVNTWTNITVIWTTEMTESIFETTFEEAGLVIFLSANHKGAIPMIWLHFCGASLTFIFMYEKNDQNSAKRLVCIK